MAWFNWLLGTRVGTFVPNESRWVMLDVETSGLDPQHDSLLAIAAIGLRVDWARTSLHIVPGDSFEVVLQQQRVKSDKDNILLHGIGVQRQREGLAPEQALQAFCNFVADSPLLAFHAAFDRALIERHLQLHRMAALRNPWLDIEQLCAVTHEALRARSLDEWLAHFGIHCAVRHQAAADTLAECELLQRIWPKVAAQSKCWRDVFSLAARQRWISRPI